MLIETDATAPSLSASTSTVANKITVSWRGDDGSGSGVANYDVYIADEGQNYVPLKLSTTQESLEYEGIANTNYTFVIRVRDKAGNLSDLTRLEVTVPKEQ
jgi:chitodextrinase